MSPLEKYYKFWSEIPLIRITKTYKLEIDWIVEAGCHDGSDTSELSKLFNPTQIFAFEPDPVAYYKAKERLNANSLSNISLFHEGLGEENSTKFLNFQSVGKGMGSTFLSEEGVEKVSVCRLDDKLPSSLGDGGLLWLDVEGHTLKALNGMRKTIPKFRIAKVEIQLHTRDFNFVRDFAEVIAVFKDAGLVALYGPLHPGYFGDVIFIRKVDLGLTGRLRSVLLTTQIRILHTYIYPALGKPGARGRR